MRNSAFIYKIRSIVGNRAHFHVPLSLYTSWGIGGPVWCLCSVIKVSEIVSILALANYYNCPIKVLGRGSNLLVSDAGFKGIMIKLRGSLASIKVCGSDILVGGGESLNAVVKFTACKGLTGLEWAIAIPGSVGGAIVTNAGAHGFDMTDVISGMKILTGDGKILTLSSNSVPGDYRHRVLPFRSILLNARLSLNFGDSTSIISRIQTLIRKRQEMQPLSTSRTAGSVFKNPPGGVAGRLIESAGLKGLTVGKAMVSFKHANFIINQGGATASEVLVLMNKIRRRVHEVSGIELEPEVEIVGNF